ncbi:YaaA family protein [Candidatus Gracilibacteria bacterium]|nr:YaaA family protein [Candidatus Gracilibacteria bacterium]
MLIVLSPSKTLDFTTAIPKNLATSTPIFQKEADLLAAEMKKLSAAQIAKMMKVSTKIAELNHHRFQNFAQTKSRPAIFAFIGDVYRDIKPHDYSTKELTFANVHIRTLSGLYGLLKPLDLIKPYRLEMHHKTDFWRDKITTALQKETWEMLQKDEMQGNDDRLPEPYQSVRRQRSEEVDSADRLLQHFPTIIDLASKEYSKPLNLKKFQTYTPIFKEKKGQEYKIVALYAKIARGTMANWIVKNAITNPEALKDFTEDGYKFAANLSTKHDFVFTRG